MEKRSNCLFFAFRKWRLKGGYICVRASRHKHWWPIKIHVLWHPDNCPETEEPCEYLESYVPDKEDLGKLPPPIFKGHLKKGD